MQYSLSEADKGYHISFTDVFTLLATGLSGLPYSTRHWELSNKCETKYFLGHRAIALLETIPLFGGLVALAERIIVFTYNSSINSSSNSPIHSLNHQLISEGFRSYCELDDKITGKTNGDIYLINETGKKHQEMLLKILGMGSNKQAIQIPGGRAILLPNMYVNDIEAIIERWGRMVIEEVKMSEILNRLGLLSPQSKRVNITLTSSSNYVIPAYICETFENLSITKRWFIIDLKNADSSTWKDTLFKLDEERLIEENWDPIFDSLLTDISKIFLYQIPTERDSLNLAIVKKRSDPTICPYEVRYFGFDFSSKRKALKIPDIETISQSPIDMYELRYLLSSMIGIIFMQEFGFSKYCHPSNEEEAKIGILKDKLVEKYITVVIARMNKSKFL